MKNVAEARIEGGKFVFNGWFRAVIFAIVGGLYALVIALGAYAFTQLDKKVERIEEVWRVQMKELSAEVVNNKVLIAQIMSMKDTIEDIRFYLRKYEQNKHKLNN